MRVPIAAIRKLTPHPCPFALRLTCSSQYPLSDVLSARRVYHSHQDPSQTMKHQPTAETATDENALIAERRSKLAALRAQSVAYPNDFERQDEAHAIHQAFADTTVWTAEALAASPHHVTLAGRIVAKRVMGKASFAHIQDGSGRIQLYLQSDTLGQTYTAFRNWDVGDIIGVQGDLTRTRTGELSVKVTALRLLTKSLRPLPDKWHGLADVEQRYRRRYVDLIVSQRSRDVFMRRFQIVSAIRQWLNSRGYIEVETPMMHSIPGGASAKPFRTHHNALATDLYLRIAPELHLKRLVVGGFERIYEINRNFRNEGVSTRHNPEFTTLELYAAYATFVTMMDVTERLIREIAQTVLGTMQLVWDDAHIDLEPAFVRWRMDEAVCHFNPDVRRSDCTNASVLLAHCQRLGLHVKPTDGWGKLLLAIFEATVERQLIAPTLITHHPVEVSPLARECDHDPGFTDRFELFIHGKEIANGFSELNDPDEQAARFHAQAQAKAAGDEEAMHFDADYIRALEYGLPPTGGLGIGIDRLVMLYTDSRSIRDVLLFPSMRPEASDA